jgi:hypothetical protein
MTDRELLELAAKAAGLRWSIGDLVWYNDMEGTYIKNWNPLADDGDALRLSVRLGIDLTLHGATFTHPYAHSEIAASYARNGDNWFEEEAREDKGIDIYAAVRRVIVRAAAEIGKAL